MSTRTFYPYRTQPEALTLRLEAVGEVPMRDDDILAHDSDVDPIELRATVEVPEGLAQVLVPPEEVEAPPIEPVVIIRSPESRQRCAVRLAADGHPAMIRLRRADWTGKVELQAVLVRGQKNPKAPVGFAVDRGSTLAWSASRWVCFDESPPRGGLLPVRWEHFSQSNAPQRKRNATHLFALDATAGQTPIIYLNSDIDEAGTVLGSRGTHGPKARIRDAIYSTIAHQVWTSLLGSAVAELVGLDVTDDDPDSVLANLREFHRGILRDWAPYLYPEADPGTALRRVISSREPTNAADLMCRVPNAIQRRFNATCGFAGLVMDYPQSAR